MLHTRAANVDIPTVQSSPYVRTLGRCCVFNSYSRLPLRMRHKEYMVLFPSIYIWWLFALPSRAEYQVEAWPISSPLHRLLWRNRNIAGTVRAPAQLPKTAVDMINHAVSRPRARAIFYRFPSAVASYKNVRVMARAQGMLTRLFAEGAAGISREEFVGRVRSLDYSTL